MHRLIALFAAAGTFVSCTDAGVLQYGDRDKSNTGTYADDPLQGASPEGLAPDVTTKGTGIYTHGFPFSPTPDDYPGTDRIYAGSAQTTAHDGYAASSLRLNGPQVITLDYSPLATGTIQTFTLGIMADDFQRPAWGQPFTASINGVVNSTLTNLLNALSQTGPRMQYVSIGLSTSSLNPNHVLTLSIDEGGDGGDGWSIDFLTVGITGGTCQGDLNSDGFVDDADFVIFVAAYNILDCADSGMPSGCPADFNADGFVDDSDFVLFVSAYNELVCP